MRRRGRRHRGDGPRTPTVSRGRDRRVTLARRKISTCRARGDARPEGPGEAFHECEAARAGPSPDRRAQPAARRGRRRLRGRAAVREEGAGRRPRTTQPRRSIRFRGAAPANACHLRREKTRAKQTGGLFFLKFSRMTKLGDHRAKGDAMSDESERCPQPPPTRSFCNTADPRAPRGPRSVDPARSRPSAAAPAGADPERRRARDLMVETKLLNGRNTALVGDLIKAADDNIARQLAARTSRRRPRRRGRPGSRASSERAVTRHDPRKETPGAAAAGPQESFPHPKIMRSLSIAPHGDAGQAARLPLDRHHRRARVPAPRREFRPRPLRTTPRR